MKELKGRTQNIVASSENLTTIGSYFLIQEDVGVKRERTFKDNHALLRRRLFLCPRVSVANKSRSAGAASYLRTWPDGGRGRSGSPRRAAA